MKIKSSKPKLLLFSRYPIEFEVIPVPGFRKVIDILLLNYSISYLTLGWAKGRNEKLNEGINSKYLPVKVDNSNSFDKWIKSFLYYLLLPFSILKIKNQNPDIIICKENMPFVPLTLAVLRKPILVEICDWWPSILLGNTKIGKKLANFIETSEIHLWNKLQIFAITRNSVDSGIIIKKGLKKNKIRLVSLPMFGGDYFPCSAEKERADLGFAKKDFVMATHGIIHLSKGYDQVLLWWKKIVLKHKNWKFLFIGGTMGEDWFRKMIQDLKLEDSVKITGWISDQSKLNRYLNSADCLLVTRRNTEDNFGTTPSGLTHSLMTGKPTVVTGLPSLKLMVQDRKNGYTFEPDSYESFKNCLEEIYSNPKKSRKIGLAGLKRIKELFDPLKSASQYNSVISTLLKEPS